MAKNNWLSIPSLVIIFIFFGAIGLALAGFTPQEFGHTLDEVELLIQRKSASCTGTSCELYCDDSYVVFSGACTTTASGNWNLYGSRSDLVFWDCVDGSANSTTSTITTNITCVKTYFDGTYSPVCGNYIVDIDTGEVCDGPNIKDIDCEDYFLDPASGGTQLCNGSIGACSSSCDGLNISQCEYCDPGACTPPQIECKDSTPQNIICALDCTPFGGPKNASGNTLGSVSSQTNWYYPPGPPLPPSIPGPGPGSGICGDGIPFNSLGEECDTGGDTSVGVAACGMQCMQCPPGTGPFVMFYGTCDPNCKCVDPQCGANPIQACVGPGPGPSPGPINP
ncbi:MAG: hypothetical protein FJY86_03720 [Candidatus Diapherotrites archaeon]|uniref:Uncharacterized protein n=1 Tax=Candidatus Iainarchaeum sp. TaxID=3101447 RepID=A0A8T4CBV5_9ARCH|nr:hypothetical protein [Candidatus Diapherotrites archaeon]